MTESNVSHHDPESFAREGPTLIYFLRRQTIGLLSTRQCVAGVSMVAQH